MIFDNVSALCKAKNISIARLERTLNLGNGTISDWGKSSPRVKNLKLVADFFGVTVDELLREDVQNES